MSDESFDDVDQRLAELESRAGDANTDSNNKTALRVSNEGRRIARQEHRLIPYLKFCYHIINGSEDAMQIKQGCDVAVEMIALLEHEDRARQFQPDLPVDEYEHIKWWATAFAYKKLAAFTGQMQGYNSEGMHQCIADGMTVCRRTGNPDDAIHFREFATEVYRSADDLDMAVHFARGSLQIQEGDDTNRKVASADELSQILSLQGELIAAVDMVQQAWNFCDEFHNPYMAHLNMLPVAREILAVAGRNDLLENLPIFAREGESVSVPEKKVLRLPPTEENPYFTFLSEQATAVELACMGHFDRAILLLQDWDRRLREVQCQSRWFGLRCRLLAILRMAGRMDQVAALSTSVEEAAATARDWLTLRRLSRIRDESQVPVPLALVADADSGPFAPTAKVSVTSATEQDPSPEVAGESELKFEKTPLLDVIAAFYERLQSCGGDPQLLEAIAADLVQVDVAIITNIDDALHLLNIAHYLTSSKDQIRPLLDWSQAIRERFPTNANAVNMSANVAAGLFIEHGDELESIFPRSRIESQFRQSLDMDSNSSGNFMRAGLYYLSQGNDGEAERCLARGFRLNRSSSQLALNLAEVYGRTDRARDSLAVLDMALREGCDDPQVAWDAALRAVAIGQFEAALTYLDRFDSLAPDEAWSNHYRAVSLLELDRPEEALAALKFESERNQEGTYHIEIQTTSALGMLRREEEFRKQLAMVLDTPLTGVTYITPHGLGRLFHRLWQSSTCLSPDDPLRRRMEDTMIGTGLASDGFFRAYRVPQDGTESTVDVYFYRVELLQPLDENWASSASCLAGEENWKAYEINWGVLAEDEEQAVECVLKWQQRCYPIPAVVMSVDASEECFEDYPGIVWQSLRSEYDGEHDEDAHAEEDADLET